MRYCLRCRRLSSDGAICTSCGGSFGGRLCDHARHPHLSPPDAHFCGRCGSTVLREAARSVPVSWIGLLFRAGALLWLAWIAGPPLLRGLGSGIGDFLDNLLGITRYRDPRVWAFETFVPWLIPLLVLYFLTTLLPARAGRQLRGLLSRILSRGVNLLFDVLQGAVRIVTRLILKFLSRDRRNDIGL